jgi:2-haloacid dehalogenase
MSARAKQSRDFVTIRPHKMQRKKTQIMLNRREFVTRVASGVALGVLTRNPRVFAGQPSLKSQIKAIAFDAFPIFDPRPVFALAERLFPGKGSEFSNEWRSRQFEYTWLRVAAQRYADFWQVTREALEFAAAKLNLDAGRQQLDQLMNAYLELKPWPDVEPALMSLKNSGFRLAFLSNFTPYMLDANIAGAGLAGLFDHVLSTDLAKTYKPDPRAYQLGTHALKLKPQEVLFVAFAGWDAAGAKLFGYPVFWVNRQRLPAERLGVNPDCTGNSLTQLVRFLA